jgi:hypothetical protein
MNYTTQNYRATSGPTLGPIGHLAPPPVLNVVSGTNHATLRGQAFLSDWTLGGRIPIATYRLTIDEQELAGTFICVSRRFKRVVS